MPPSATPVFRIDKFEVPAAARLELMAVIQRTHALLGTLPGCRQNIVLEQVSGPGVFNLVTLVEWADGAAMQAARSKVEALHQHMGVKPQELLARLGVKADLANYQALS